MRRMPSCPSTRSTCVGWGSRPAGGVWMKWLARSLYSAQKTPCVSTTARSACQHCASVLLLDEGGVVDLARGVVTHAD